jgi:CheY-like chemotaxis protein
MSHVLVIDDSDGIRSTLKTMLESAGHNVAVAFDGVDGLRQFWRRSFDLVISDIVMPRKDGLETVRELRQITSDVPIIVMSGGLQPANRGRSQRDIDDLLYVAEDLGATRTISKPFSRTDLLAVVGECLGEAETCALIGAPLTPTLSPQAEEGMRALSASVAGDLRSRPYRPR